jgi:hypothetical protein
MTTPWVPYGLWMGKTVAVLGSGPSMTQELADSVRHLPRICARRAARFAMDADLLVALDGPADADSWRESEGFAGLRIVGFERDDLDARYLHIAHERVTLGEGHVVEIRNNGLVAIRIAAMAGAAKIVLLGFDRGQYGAHAPAGAGGYVGLEEGLDALIAELGAKGIEVERVA